MKKCVECGKELSEEAVEEGRERCIQCQIEDDATAMLI